MSSPMRFDKGVTNVPASKTLGQYLSSDPTLMHTFFDDFDTYAGSTWTATASSGSVALADGDGGDILLTTNASDNAVAAIQLVKEGFTVASGKKMWFKTRVDLGGATQQDAVVGLHVTDTSPIATAPSDGVYFRKDDGDTNWDFVIQKSSAAVATIAGVATATTNDIDLGWYFDGVDTFSYFVNDVLTGTVTTTGFPTTELNVSAAVQAGNSSAATMTVDYILAAKER